MSLLIEIQYFPPIISYATLIKSNHIDFSIYENYRRRSFRNRCIIAGANGLISLSIPIAGGRNQKKVFGEVRIDYSVDWQQQHWRSIFSAYGKSPWFFHYADSLEKLFSQKIDLLVDWNRHCLNWINETLEQKMELLAPGFLENQSTLGGLGTPGESSDTWKVGEPLEGSGTFGDLSQRWRVGKFLEGVKESEKFNRERAGEFDKEILDWRDRILPANYQDPGFGPFPVYTQVFEDRFGFQPNLSILDFVLCSGKGQLNKLLAYPV